MGNIRSKVITDIINNTKEHGFLSMDDFGVMSFTINKDIRKKIIDGTISEVEVSSLVDEINKWINENEATHYTHWFYPLRGSVAEKHDSFISIKDGDGMTTRMRKKISKRLSFDEILKQEPDASSFPSGGMRSTFESRGYTIWDPTSPLFIIDDTVYIPTTFVSYNGKILDFKTPLLKSVDKINKAATDVCKYFDEDVKCVYPTLGWEQEFFVIDRRLYLSRPDLVLTNRTLFGHQSAKDQQLSNNYLGTMPKRVRNFIKDVESEAYKLGIPLKTRHNEVAPNQFEIAPIYEDVNVSIDHNILVMNILNEVSIKYDLKVLFHEKPFYGINGSGKHNNWSLSTDKGDNLLSPGKTDNEKFRFFTFLVNTVKAISNYPNLLRASISTPENEHRLGGHEAPPAIISVFIGKQLSDIMDKFEDTMSLSFDDDKNGINISSIPDIFIDNTDRNRTSPFAFTGNKFEFRAPGSSVNCAKPMTILNMIVADQLMKFKSDIEKNMTEGRDIKDIMKNILMDYIKDSKFIRFEGDGYSDEWIEEATKRGLKNIKSTPDVMKFYLNDDIIDLYERLDVLDKEEIYSRYEIKLEKYVKKIQIESRVIGELSLSHIIPSAIEYQNKLLNNRKLKSRNYMSSNYVNDVSIEIDDRVNRIYKNVKMMINERKKANKMSLVERADYYSKFVYPLFDKIRYDSDKLEMLIDDDMWKLPKYRELLFMI